MSKDNPKKYKVRRKLREMTDADVNFVSLVDRGANRIPFRVVKRDNSENEMIHIHKKTTVTPSIVAVVAKSAVVDETRALLESLGMSVETTEELDGHTIFKQADYFDEDHIVGMEISPDVMLLCRDVKLPVEKAFVPWNQSSDFATNVQTQGYFPGMMVAQEALNETIRTALGESSSVPMASEMIDNALLSFHEYVMSMTESLPTLAFKMEQALPAMTETAKSDKSRAAASGFRDTLIEALTGVFGSLPEAAQKSVSEAVTSFVEVTGGDSADVKQKFESAVKAPLNMESAVDTNKANASKSKAKAENSDAAGSSAALLDGGPEAEVLKDETEVADVAIDGAEVAAVEGAEAPDAEAEAAQKAADDAAAVDAAAVTAAAAEAPKTDLSEITGMLGKLLEAQKVAGDQSESVATSVKTLKDTVEALGNRISEVEEVAKSAKTAVTGTVSSNTTQSDGQATNAKKSAGKSIWAGTMPGLPGNF